ncbi:MAG: MATE family efflux transporter [Acutalibacteraceae bacterium]
MFKVKNINMLEGPLLKNIILYTIPIIFTGILQLLFNAADIIVVGRYGGMRSVAAVGSTSSIINLLVNLFMGLSTGTGILTAQGLGANNNKSVKQAIHTAIPTALISGIIISVVGILFAETFLRLMQSPESVLPLAALYMKIYFIGIPATMVYNFGSAILRAAGDTKSPLVYLCFSGAVNVFLNLIFVILFDMDVAGVAIATVISQVLSAVLVIKTLMKRTDACRLILKEFKIHAATLRKIMTIGVPAGIQSSVFSISNVIIQSSINSLGEVVVSGSAAAANIEGFVYMAMNAFHHTALNFTGQNFGAGNHKRAKRVFYLCLICVAVTGIVLGNLVYFLGRQLLSIYLPDSPAAIEQGLIRMSFVCSFYFLCGIMDVTIGAIRGIGVTLSPMFISVTGVCVFRLGWIFTIFSIPKFHTASNLYISYPITWGLTFISLLVTYFIIVNKITKNHNERQNKNV